MVCCVFFSDFTVIFNTIKTKHSQFIFIKFRFTISTVTASVRYKSINDKLFLNRFCQNIVLKSVEVSRKNHTTKRTVTNCDIWMNYVIVLVIFMFIRCLSFDFLHRLLNSYTLTIYFFNQHYRE
ncbi:unknown [Salmonella phage FelixO1]|uniref:Uncharacterized protein n=1 Tax=Salmonella phage Felix O1 (isolate Felix O1-VT1) TaxID=1283336 RepID=Q6KGA6_BPFO1|nr:unknown [Salmonella phage FelixO1]